MGGWGPTRGCSVRERGKRRKNMEEREERREKGRETRGKRDDNGSHGATWAPCQHLIVILSISDMIGANLGYGSKLQRLLWTKKKFEM